MEVTLSIPHAFDAGREPPRLYEDDLRLGRLAQVFLLAGRGEGADDVSVDVRDPGWQKHFEAFKAQMCPTCIRNRVPFCVHQAPYRNGVAQAKTARDAPSEVREKLCKRLWEEVIRGPDASAIRASMSDRAHNGIQRDE